LWKSLANQGHLYYDALIEIRRERDAVFWEGVRVIKPPVATNAARAVFMFNRPKIQALLKLKIMQSSWFGHCRFGH
jgi:hypothetical protein